MAALPVITNVYRVALNWTATGGQIAANVIHIRDESGTITVPQLRTELDAAASVNMWWGTTINAKVTDIAITPLDGIHATSHGAPATTAKWTGKNGTTWAPALSILMKMGTGLRGRTHRGRTFLPFIEDAAVVDGIVDPTTVTGLTGAWQTFSDNLSGGAHNLSLGVASYKLAQFNIAVALDCEPVAGTQRRRQGRLRGA